MHERRADGADAWVVQHVQAPRTSPTASSRRGREIFGSEPAFVSEVGPVIGAHVGPGLSASAGSRSRCSATRRADERLD